MPPNARGNSILTMEYRRLGRTGLDVSVVGFGTNELRLVPERQAIETLVRGFELGVNLVHTSPDYEGAEDLVARAVHESGRPVLVASQGYDVHHNTKGPVRHFEELFEQTCTKLGTDRLELYGIASVDDREAYGENVWGPDGMVEFLLNKKEEGRLGSIFCTCHGEPSFVRRLVESDVFDAVMLSYNPLGFHLLSLSPPAGRHFENLARTRHEIFPLCRERDVGVMVMMPLAGGLLTDSLAFPPDVPAGDPNIMATDVLRTILEDPNVACVVPGTASIEEAEENARAGHAPLLVSDDARRRLAIRVSEVQTSHCSRCGTCESLCSRGLPVSWLFRAADMAVHRGERFETWEDVEYFRLHPHLDAVCASCTDVTCGCPYGIDIPRSLINVHDEMSSLMKTGLVPPPQELNLRLGTAEFGARKVSLDIPLRMKAGETVVCRVQLENAGMLSWSKEPRSQDGVTLEVWSEGSLQASSHPRDDVHSGQRGYFVFELTAPGHLHSVELSLRLVRNGVRRRRRPTITLSQQSIAVAASA